jgi:hypothetical protein
MSMLPITFKDDVELIQFAQKFVVDDRLASLENDVERCLPSDKKEAAGYAPFPALMYCFSIIDLLGSLYAGNARGGNTTNNAARYMERYLKYSEEKLRLLQKIYRHKIVHLSQPKFAMLYNRKIIAWKLDEYVPSKHLTIEQTPGDAVISGSFRKIRCDAQYVVSIKALKDDIKHSVTRYPDGYMEDLRKDPDLQSKFVTAINQVYDPVVTD